MIKSLGNLFILSFSLLFFASCHIAQTPTESTGLKIIKSTKIAHGGEKLDNLKTLRIKDTDPSGYENMTLIDFTTSKYRRETRKNYGLEVTQFEGNETWIWTNNKKSQLSEMEKSQLKKVFCFGEFSLRSSCLETTSFGETIFDEEAKSIYLTVKSNGEDFGYTIDEQNRLKEINIVRDGVKRRFIFDDFRTVSGIVFAFTKTSKVSNSGMPKIEMKDLVTKIMSIEVNSEFTASDWAVPN